MEASYYSRSTHSRSGYVVGRGSARDGERCGWNSGNGGGIRAAAFFTVRFVSHIEDRRSKDNIGRFNWCQYCFDQLLDDVTKLKTETASGFVQANNLSGCHLFFQIFLLDNLDLGIFNMSHSVIPRAQHFNGVRLKQMVLMCSHKINGSNVYVAPPVLSVSIVCYTKHNFITDHLPLPHPDRKDASSGRKSDNRDIQPSPLYKGASEHRTGTADFFRFLHEQYPSVAGTPLGCALKQHNARCLFMANQIKNQMVEENIRFTKNFIGIAGGGSSKAATPLGVA